MGIKEEEVSIGETPVSDNINDQIAHQVRHDEEWNSSSSLKDLLEFAPILITLERQIVSILLARGFVKLYNTTDTVDDYCFDNIELTSKGRNIELDDPEMNELAQLVSTLTSISHKVTLSKSSKVSISDDDVEAYRQIFPVGSRGPGAKVVKHRLEKFLLENDCTYEEIVSAAKLYIRHNSSKGYNIMGAHFFLYKRDQQSKVDESKAEEFLEQVRNSHQAKDWRDSVV